MLCGITVEKTCTFIAGWQLTHFHSCKESPSWNLMGSLVCRGSIPLRMWVTDISSSGVSNLNPLICDWTNRTIAKCWQLNSALNKVGYPCFWTDYSFTCVTQIQRILCGFVCAQIKRCRRGHVWENGKFMLLMCDVAVVTAQWHAGHTQLSVVANTNCDETFGWRRLQDVVFHCQHFDYLSGSWTLFEAYLCLVCYGYFWQHLPPIYSVWDYQRRRHRDVPLYNGRDAPMYFLAFDLFSGSEGRFNSLYRAMYHTLHSYC